MSMQVATIGGQGLIGERFITLAGQNGIQCTDFDKATSGFDVRNFQDVTDVVSRRDLGSTVVLFAAFTDVTAASSSSEAGDETGLCYQLNVAGAENVAKACRAAGKHLVYVSTVMVFAGEEGVRYDETSEPAPVEWYGETKLRGERGVQSICGDNSTIVRVGFPFRAAFVPKPDIVRRMQQHLTVQPHSTLPPQFSNQSIIPVFIDDIAAAMEVIVRERPTGILHAVGATTLSTYELALKVAQRTPGADPQDVSEGDFAYFARQGRNYPQYLDVSSPVTQRILDLPARDIDTTLDELMKQQAA